MMITSSLQLKRSLHIFHFPRWWDWNLTELDYCSDFLNPQLYRMHDKDKAWMDNKGNLCFPFKWLDRNISSLTVIHQWMSTRRIVIHQIMS